MDPITIPHRRPAVRLATLAAAVAAALALAACGKPETPTAGEQVDRAIAQTRDAAAEVRAEAREAATDAAQATRDAAQTVAGSARDLGITAKVNAELAKDGALSALGIDVDTRDGHVTLSGRAPDADARERATRLAAAIDGVRHVENRLVIEKRS